MTSHTWQTILAITLVLNGGLIAGYRFYRMKKGGPKADAIGGAVLGIVLLGFAILIALDAGWARWPALVYALLFGVIVMPIWVLGVLIPLRPGAPDWTFTSVYWATLFLIAAAALLA